MTATVAVKERPILFSGSMVLAILEDRKTMTRRVLKFEPLGDDPKITKLDDGRFLVEHWPKQDRCFGNFGRCVDVECPYGKPGDRLWVRETHWRYGKWRKNGLTASGRQRWRFIATRGHNEDREPGQYVHFEAPSIKPERQELGWHKRPSIFLPRKFARITLEITGVRVERLIAVTHGDAKAEGISDPRPELCRHLNSEHFACCAQYPHTDYRSRFGDLWDSINGKRPGCAWSDDPWVWVVSFRRI